MAPLDKRDMVLTGFIGDMVNGTVDLSGDLNIIAPTLGWNVSSDDHLGRIFLVHCH